MEHVRRRLQEIYQGHLLPPFSGLLAAPKGWGQLGEASCPPCPWAQPRPRRQDAWVLGQS
jgi:hypothetical protein